MSLRNQLRHHYRSLDQAQDSISWEELVERVEADTTIDLAPRRRSYRRLVAAGAAAAILVVVGVLGVLTSPLEDIARTGTSIDFTELTPVEFEFDPADRQRLENQAEFVRLFTPSDGAGCTGPGAANGEGPNYRGPYLCYQRLDPPLVPETVTIETVVGDTQTTPGEPGDPDDRPILTVQMDEVRDLIEPRLADLYIWALNTYPEATEEACGVGFTGDDEAIAWNPGYRADIPCGEFLLSQFGQFLIETAAP